MATELVTYSANTPHPAYACGLLTSDGTIAYIETGFTPVKIVAVNYTATNPLMYMWQKGQAEANCFLNTGSTGVLTKGVTGPYPYGDTSDDTPPTTQYTPASTGSFRGFTIPDAITADGDTWTWEAWGE